MNKVAVITGAASGIGLDIALFLREKGFQPVVLDIQAPPAELDLPWVACDVSDEGQVQSTFEKIHQDWGPTQVLVNNSGLQHMSPVETFPLQKWKLLLDVMLTGTFLCSRAAIPAMKNSGKGRIINISSVHGKEASPFKSAYVAAKHGVLGLTKVMAKELAEHGITVNAICPGFVDTPLMRNQLKSQMELNKLSEEEVLAQIFLKQQDIKKLTQPRQVSELVGFLISDSADTITGEALNISGGWGM